MPGPDDPVGYGVPLHLPGAVMAEQTVLQVPSHPDWIDPTVEYLRHKAVLCGVCQEARANRLVVALHEALSNAIIHGNLELSSELKEHPDSAFSRALALRASDPRFAGRLVEIGVDYDGERCRWLLTDQGPGFDVDRVLHLSHPPGTLLASGRGIILMRAFMDEVCYEAGGRRVVLTLYKASGMEKRRHARHPLHRLIRIAPIRADGSVDWEAAYEAVAQNLSADGINILQARLSTARRILIGIGLDSQFLYLPAEVRHCQAMAGNVVELGCRFQAGATPPGPVSEPEPTANVEEAVEGLLRRLRRHRPGPERRAHPRAVYTERIHIQGPAATDLAIGSARDLSRAGVAFLTTAPLPLADVILSLPQGKRPTLRVRARLVRCAKVMDGVYHVGARFRLLEP